MFDKTKSNYNKYVPVSKPFQKYRTYLYRINDREFFINRYLKLIYVLKGSLEIIIANESIHLSKGDVFYVGPNIPYSFKRFEGENTVLVLDIRCKYLKALVGDDYGSSILKDIGNERDKILKNMITIYMAMLYDQWNHRLVLDLLDETIYCLERTQKMTYKPISDGSVECTIYDITIWIVNNLEYINYNNILLKDISDKFNTNYYYLSRKFKEIVGLNYTELILYIYLERAVEMLINTNDNMSTIALESHFKNIKIFYSSFKSIFEMTPLEFRKKYRNFQEVIIEDDIHREEATQKLFKKINDKDNEYFMASPKIDYRIDLSEMEKIKFNTDMDTIELNNIVDVLSNIYYLPQIAQDFKGSNIVINIICDNRGLFLINKDKKERETDIYQLKYIIDLFRDNDSKVLLTFNQDLDLREPVARDKILRLLKLLKNDIVNSKEYVFGLRFWNLREHILEGCSLAIKSIQAFMDISDEIFKDYDFRWVLYLDDELKSGDDEYIKTLTENLTKKPDKYILTYGFDKNFIIDMEEKIDSFIGELKTIHRLLDLPAEKISVKLRHQVSKTLDGCSLAREYLMLFSMNIFIKLKSHGFSFGYFDYYLDEENDEVNYKEFTHDQLGLVRPYFLIYDLLSALDGFILPVSRELNIVQTGNVLYILLYSDYFKFLEYILNTRFIDGEKRISYRISLENFKGKFKLLSYNFHLHQDYMNLEEDELMSISNYDRHVLSLSRLSNSSLTFKEASGSLDIQIEKDILDVGFIKVKKI